MFKRMALVLSAVLMIASVTACGSSNSSGNNGNGNSQASGDAATTNTGATSTPAKKITLRYATGDSGPAVALQEQIVKSFNESQDKIEVKLETYGTAFDQKLTAAIGAGNAPDIVKMWNFPAYYQALVPLEDKINALPDKSDFYPTLFNYANMKGHLYGMPIGFSTRALYYNKKLTDAAGITVKDDWTMDDFKAALQKATKGDVKGLYFYYNPDPYAFESILWSNGGEWLDGNGKPVINSKANKEAIQYIHDLIYKDKVAYAGNYADDFGQAMASGKYAFGESGKWFIPSIQKAGIDLGIAPMPGFKKGTSMSVVHASYLSITKDCKNADAAWEFVKYYTSYASVKKMTAVEMPVRQSVAKDIGYLKNPLMKPFYTMLDRSKSKRPSLVKSEKWPQVSSEIADALQAIFSQNQVDIGKVLDETQSKAESILK